MIVSGGSAWAILAARLTEDESRTVLLLEYRGYADATPVYEQQITRPWHISPRRYLQGVPGDGNISWTEETVRQPAGDRPEP